MQTTVNCTKSKKLNHKIRIVAGLLVFGGALLSTTAVIAQSSPRDISSRLNRLENEIQTLSRSVYRGETPPPGAMDAGGLSASDTRFRTETQTRIQQMEDEIRNLRGMIEEQGFTLSRMSTKMDRVLGDVEMRLGDLEGNGGANVRTLSSAEDDGNAENPSLSDIPTAAGDATSDYRDEDVLASRSGASTLGRSDDKIAAEYESAFAHLKGGDYEQAGGEFLAFIKKYPDHVLSGNAKYWLGETFYVRGDFQRAARVFAEGYKEYPQSGKRADYLLKLGLSLSSMGSKDDACVALGQLESEYGSSPTPVVKRGQAEQERIGCYT